MYKINTNKISYTGEGIQSTLHGTAICQKPPMQNCRGNRKN